MRKIWKLVIGIGVMLGMVGLSVTAQASSNNEMTIKHYSFSLKESGADYDTAIPMRYDKVEIYGLNSTTGESNLLDTTTTDGTGSIDNLGSVKNLV